MAFVIRSYSTVLEVVQISRITVPFLQSFRLCPPIPVTLSISLGSNSSINSKSSCQWNMCRVHLLSRMKEFASVASVHELRAR